MADQSRPGGKGYDVEEALRAYFFEAGYFVVRGVPYQLDGEDVTDIDLWLYERPAAATRRRIIVDVKNKKSPKAAERIIWTRGLQEALAVDAAIVATTDRRQSSRRLAKSLGVTLFDGDAIARVTGAKRLTDQNLLSVSQMEELIRSADASRRTTVWRDTMQGARGSLLSGMGVHSANKCLAAFGFFAREAAVAHPASWQAGLAIRLAYLSAALALISLDFVIADHAFRRLEERRAMIVNAVRFGQAELTPHLGAISTALNLTRKYAPNGAAVARQLELGFAADAERIPAEIIADFVGRVSTGDMLFQIARELESASSRHGLAGFDALSAPAKSALGAFLDFSEVAREEFARSWESVRGENPRGAPTSEIGRGPATQASEQLSSSTLSSKDQRTSPPAPGVGPLFSDEDSGSE